MPNRSWSIAVGLALVALYAGSAGASKPLDPGAAAALDAIAARTHRTPDHTVSARTSFPSVIAGALSAPASGSPVEIAERFVDDNPGLFAAGLDDLRLARSVPNALGRTVRLAQTYDGLPVVGAELAIVVGRDGSVRIASSSLEPLAWVDTAPAVTDVDAIDAARALAPRPTLAADAFSRLVIVPLPGGVGRLAWEIHLGAIPGLLTNLWAYVDAQTGAVIRYENRIAFDYTGRAFETNPGDFGGPYADPIEVPLDIPDGGVVYTGDTSSESACDYDDGAADCALCEGTGCVWLSNPLYLARNCPDYHQTMPLDLSSYGLGTLNAHFCSEVQTASADASGDFFYPWEGSNNGLDDLNPTDKFAEVQMFHHVGLIYAYYLGLMDDHPDAAALDWDGLDTVPLMATVNFEIPIKMTSASPDIANAVDPNGELFPYDNAFFLPAGPTEIPGLVRPFDSIVFGQGTSADFAWDGDVIYHEFTHSVENSVSVGVGQWAEFGDAWGVNPEEGGMSEGYADAFAGFFTDEPRMGEYAFAGVAPRDMAGDDVCPRFLAGEEHDDSAGWSQSLYQAREAVAGDDAGRRHRFEQAAYVGLTAVAANQGFAEAALATAAAIEDLFDATARADAEAVFAAHGTDDCPRVLSDDGTGMVEKGRIAAPAAVNGAAATPFVPGILQYEVTVADADAALNLTMNVSADTTTSFLTTPPDPDMRVLVSEGAPIQFSYTGSQVSVDGPFLGPFGVDADDSFSLVGAPPGQYYVMPINVGEGRGVLGNLKAFAGNAVAGADGTFVYEGSGGDAGVDAGTDTDTDAGGGGGKDDGCGCSAVGGARPASGSVLGAVLSAL